MNVTHRNESERTNKNNCKCNERQKSDLSSAYWSLRGINCTWDFKHNINLQFNSSLNYSYLPQLNVKPPSSELIVQNLLTLIWPAETSFTIYISVILQFNPYVGVFDLSCVWSYLLNR